MLQASAPNIPSIFQTHFASVFIWMLYMFHTYVESVLSWRCICFTIVFQVFSGVFTTILDGCFNYFICLYTYVANVLSGCFKSRLCVAHVAMALLAGGRGRDRIWCGPQRRSSNLGTRRRQRGARLGRDAAWRGRVLWRGLSRSAPEMAAR
jgi:hypothetical protein